MHFVVLRACEVVRVVVVVVVVVIVVVAVVVMVEEAVAEIVLASAGVLLTEPEGSINFYRAQSPK